MYTYYLKFSRDDDEDRKNWGSESEKSLIDQISGEEEILVERGRREKCFHQFPIQPRSPQFRNDKRRGGGSDWRVVVARNPAQLGSDQVFVR